MPELSGWYDSIYTGPQAPYGGGDFQVPTSGFTVTGSYAYRPAIGMQLSVGEVLRDLGDFIVTTAGETLRVIVDQWGRRLVQKTGEILAQTPLGPATAGAYARQGLEEYLPVIIGGGLLLFALLRR